jgi:hypothetical protein
MWVRACAFSIAGFLCLHAAYFLPPFSLPLWLTSLLGWVLLVEVYFFLAAGVAAAILLLALAGMLSLSSLLAPRTRGWIGGWLTTPSGSRRWAFRPWLHTVGWTSLFFGHLGLDTEPRLAFICLSGSMLLCGAWNRPALRWGIPIV